MAQCVAQKEGITLAMLKAMKGLGCGAFNSNNSVSEKALDEWLSIPENQEALERESHGIKGKIDYENWRKLKIANDYKEKLYELRSNTVARIQKIGADYRAYQAAVVREKPAALAMTTEDIPRTRIELQKVMDEITKKLQSFAEHWGVKI